MLLAEVHWAPGGPPFMDLSWVTFRAASDLGPRNHGEKSHHPSSMYCSYGKCSHENQAEIQVPIIGKHAWNYKSHASINLLQRCTVRNIVSF